MKTRLGIRYILRFEPLHGERDLFLGVRHFAPPLFYSSPEWTNGSRENVYRLISELQTYQRTSSFDARLLDAVLDDYIICASWYPTHNTGQYRPTPVLATALPPPGRLTPAWPAAAA